MGDTQFDVHGALDGAQYPARRRTLVALARSKRAPSDVVNKIHRIADKEYASTSEVDEAIREVARNEENVWRTLDAPAPPTAPLSNTTDYEQLVIAWAKRQSLSLDQLVERLDESGAPRAMQLAAALGDDERKRAAFEIALREPLSADASVPEEDDSEDDDV